MKHSFMEQIRLQAILQKQFSIVRIEIFFSSQCIFLKPEVLILIFSIASIVFAVYLTFQDISEIKLFHNQRFKIISQGESVAIRPSGETCEIITQNTVSFYFASSASHRSFSNIVLGAWHPVGAGKPHNTPTPEEACAS